MTITKEAEKELTLEKEAKVNKDALDKVLPLKKKYTPNKEDDLDN